jgi:hypothetical protein
VEIIPVVVSDWKTLIIRMRFFCCYVL